MTVDLEIFDSLMIVECRLMIDDCGGRAIQGTAKSRIFSLQSLTNHQSLIKDPHNWSRAGRCCLDSRNLLTNQSLRHLGHNLRDKLVRRVRRQALDDATSHFVHETVRHSCG